MSKLSSLISNGSPENNHTFKLKWTPELDNSYRLETGYTYLYLAVSFENIEIVQFLLDNGIDADQPTVEGRTPLMVGWSIHGINFTSYRVLLLKHGGNPYLTCSRGISTISRAGLWNSMDEYLESYLVVELVCGEVDNLPKDLWRVVKPYIYTL